MTPAARFPSTMTVLASYRCTAACENCCFGSHPGIEERIPLDRILEHIDSAARLGTVHLIVFSGGESFLLGDELVVAIARCTEHRIAARVVTNGYWAATEQRALERLEPLWDAGLREINISTGDYHQAFVSPEQVVNGAVAGVGIGMNVLIVVESRLGRRFTADKLLADPRLAALVGNPRFKVIESPWMSMEERAAVEQNLAVRSSRKNLHLRGGCDSVLNTIVVTPREHLGACCGLTREQIPEMDLGSLREHSMEELYRRGAGDFMKMWLAVDGPERILAWAAAKDPEIEWELRYSHHCDACRALYDDPRVRRAIRDHWHEERDDVLLRFALLERYGRPADDTALIPIGRPVTAPGPSGRGVAASDEIP